MKNRNPIVRRAIMILGLSAAAAASAQFALESRSQDAGGGPLSGLVYTLNGTVAQQDAGPLLQSTTYTLRGGFWAMSNTAPPTNSCIADFDNDGDVDLGDFGGFGAAFGTFTGDMNYNTDADFDNDGDVDLGDFGAFGSDFGRSDCLD